MRRVNGTSLGSANRRRRSHSDGGRWEFPKERTTGEFERHGRIDKSRFPVSRAAPGSDRIRIVGATTAGGAEPRRIRCTS